MGDELKPCPVCHKDGATDRYIRDGRQIFCPHCGWSAPPTFHGPNFEQRLADSWNTRTETQSQATIDALRESLAFYADYHNWHWHEDGFWLWNGPGSAFFKGDPSATDTAYPDAECVAAEVGKRAADALLLARKGDGE